MFYKASVEDKFEKKSLNLQSGNDLETMQGIQVFGKDARLFLWKF